MISTLPSSHNHSSGTEEILRDELNVVHIGDFLYSEQRRKTKTKIMKKTENPTLTDEFSNNFCKEFCFSCEEISTLVLCNGINGQTLN